MKIYVEIPAEKLQVLAVKIAEKVHLVSSIMPLFNQRCVFYQDRTKVGAWMDIPADITSAGFYEGGSFTEGKLVIVDSETKERLFTQIVPIVLNRFEKSKVYLLPYSAGPITKIQPPSLLCPVENSDGDLVFSPSHYLYVAEQEHVPLTSSSVNDCFLVDGNFVDYAVKRSQRVPGLTRLIVENAPQTIENIRFHRLIK